MMRRDETMMYAEYDTPRFHMTFFCILSWIFPVPRKHGIET